MNLHLALMLLPNHHLNNILFLLGESCFDSADGEHFGEFQDLLVEPILASSIEDLGQDRPANPPPK